MDKLITEFEEKIAKDINESKLPIEVIRLVLIEVQNSVVAECQRVRNEQEKGENTNGIQ